MATVKRVHGGNLREAAEKYGIDQNTLLDFSANINPLGPSPKAVDAILNNIESVTNYPDPEVKLLRDTASEWLGIPENMIVAGNGAVEILYLLVQVMAPRRALIPAPTFNEYEIAVRNNGGSIKDCNLNEKNDFSLEIEDVCKDWQDTDLIFICNPNNPTGNLICRGKLQELIEKASRLGKYIIVDEAFMDFVSEKNNYSVVDLVSKYDNLFVLYSLTKFFAIPGLRLGLGLGNPGLIDKINRIRDPWNVNCFAQLAGTASLMDEEFSRAAISYVTEEKRYLFNEVSSIKGLKPHFPSVNYMLINVRDTGYSSADICKLLGNDGILVRDCSSYKNLAPVYIRTAVKKREENEKLIDSLKGLGRK